MEIQSAVCKCVMRRRLTGKIGTKSMTDVAEERKQEAPKFSY